MYMLFMELRNELSEVEVANKKPAVARGRHREDGPDRDIVASYTSSRNAGGCCHVST